MAYSNVNQLASTHQSLNSKQTYSTEDLISVGICRKSRANKVLNQDGCYLAASSFKILVSSLYHRSIRTWIFSLLQFVFCKIQKWFFNGNPPPNFTVLNLLPIGLLSLVIFNKTFGSSPWSTRPVHITNWKSQL